MVRGGSLATPDGTAVRADLVLEGTDRGLILRAVTTGDGWVTKDTIDATGLYVHSANAFDRAVARIGRPALYVLRRGPGPGDPAVGIIGETGWRPISENHPPGPQDERVGCYTMERDPWGDPMGITDSPNAVWVPDGLRLYWQYLWHPGRERLLVATDLEGRIGGSTAVPAWWPLPGDSLRVAFLEGVGGGVIFELAEDGRGYVGEAEVRGDRYPGPAARAGVRLTRVDCPGA